MGRSGYRTTDLSYGEFGIKVEECGWLSANEIESARRTITHHTKRVGKFFFAFSSQTHWSQTLVLVWVPVNQTLVVM